MLRVILRSPTNLVIWFGMKNMFRQTFPFSISKNKVQQILKTVHRLPTNYRRIFFEFALEHCLLTLLSSNACDSQTFYFILDSFIEYMDIVNFHTFKVGYFQRSLKPREHVKDTVPRWRVVGFRNPIMSIVDRIQCSRVHTGSTEVYCNS